MNADFFGFESDFVDSLRCVPMAVRMRLDVTGIKLKLNEWSKFGNEDRLRLAQLPCGTPEEILRYRIEVSSLVERICGNAPSMLAELPEPDWENPAVVPDQVTAQARALNLECSVQAWASLTPQKRFALIKLSRPGHENRNFLPAMIEFGLAPSPR